MQPYGINDVPSACAHIHVWYKLPQVYVRSLLKRVLRNGNSNADMGGNSYYGHNLIQLIRILL